MSILAVGSIGLDTIQTPFGQVTDALGGSATFFSIAASFFSPVNLVAIVGSDFPQETLNYLESRGISTEGIEKANGKTFRWKGLYENDMNAAKTLSTDLNVFQTFQPKIPIHLKKSPFVFLANIDPELQLNVLEQMEKPKLIGCDTMNLWIQSKPKELNELLKKVDILLLNDGEARQLTGITNLVKASYDLIKRGPKIVVIKKGEHGAILATKDFFFVAPAFPVEDVFDPTGAGDCFAGGFFASLITSEHFWNESSLRSSVIFGTVLASYNVESFSFDRLKKLSKEEIYHRYTKFKQFTHFEPADMSTTFPPLSV
ncbi:MAG: PfkB family carbohydrate kinase [Elusimicrobiota bacterium]